MFYAIVHVFLCTTIHIHEGKAATLCYFYLHRCQTTYFSNFFRVQEHDYLIHIAEHNVCFSEFDEAMDILKSADRPLTMWFRRLDASSIAGIKAAKENAGK